MELNQLLARCAELRQFVDWTDQDARLLADVYPHIRDGLDAVVDDFYAAIQRNEVTRRVLAGDGEQLARLKQLFRQWLDQLFCGPHDASYATRRWNVGLRHVAIGLDQTYTIVALSRIRIGLEQLVRQQVAASGTDPAGTLTALHRALDLDLALIEDAYQYAMAQRQQRAERLATIGQMAGGIAHELRNPLNVIATSAYFLQQAWQSDDARIAVHLQRISRQVQLSNQVITALCDFARLPLPETQPVPPDAMLEEVLAASPPPPNIQVVRAWASPLPDVCGDRRQLLIVLQNLVRNALESMPSGGRLTLSIAASGPAVELAITDTGPGIAPEELAHLFEPFFTTKARGIGLGLAISRAIVENHSGRIAVTSEPGQGTRFVVRLPAASGNETTTGQHQP